MNTEKIPHHHFSVILNKQTPEAEFIPDIKGISQTLEAFFSYAHSKRCLGLAANQCDFKGERFNWKAIVIKDVKTMKATLAIHPKITRSYGDGRMMDEGCLTWPMQKIRANRFYKIDVEYIDMDEKIHKVTARGLQAQVWQHEINHINGIEENVFPGDKFSYVDKVGRNEGCPCGSGKKFKKCCINNN